MKKENAGLKLNLLIIGLSFVVVLAELVQDYFENKVFLWNKYFLILIVGFGILIALRLIVHISINRTIYKQYGQYNAPQKVKQLTNLLIAGASKDSDLKEWEEAVGVINKLISDVERINEVVPNQTYILKKEVDDRYTAYLKKHFPDHPYLHENGEVKVPKIKTEMEQ